MMSACSPIVLVSVDEMPPLALADWSGACAGSLSAGDRLITLFGRAQGPRDVVLTAVLLAGEGGLRVLRGCGRRGDSFASLTVNHPAAQMFERELWEQTGLQPVGHPWLKPVRFEGSRQQQMTDYPFFSVRGQQMHELGVGPIHASVIEPGHFRFMCHGEQVHHLEIQLGYQHRGVESLLLQRAPLSLTSLVETIAGDSSIAYAWGYCAAVEAVAGVQIAMAAEQVRGIALEMERVAMHLAGLTGLATDIAFLQGGATYGRLRTAIINATMRVCGSRFARGWLRPGGVRFGLSSAVRQDLLDTLAAFSRDSAEVNGLMLGARSVQSRFKGVGTVTRKAANDLGLVGLAARASGVAFDTRARLPGWLYTAQPVDVLVDGAGDCWARLKLRMHEIDESVRWIRQVLESADAELAAPVTVPLPGLRPNTLCVSVREGFRGPVVQSLETDGGGRLLHYKVQDPSLLNWFGLALAMRDNEISDFPICNKSFDLSYCGNDL